MKVLRFKKQVIFFCMTLILIMTSVLTVLADTLFIEAESGTQDAASPMLIGSGSGAYGDKYIYGENNGGEKISYDFTIQEAGDYYIWFRMMGQESGSNSLFVKVDGKGFNQDTGATDGEYYTLDMWEESEGFDYAASSPNPFLPSSEHMKDTAWLYNPNWHWIPLSYRDATTATPSRFNFIKKNFTAGKHTIEIMTREPNTYLDKIVVTNDLTYDLTKKDADTQDPQADYLAKQAAAAAPATEAATTAAPAPAAPAATDAAAPAPAPVAAPAAPVAAAPVSAAPQTADNVSVYAAIILSSVILSALIFIIRRRREI